MRKVVFAAVAAAVLAAAGVASAQMPAPADLIKAWDKDGDGAVSKEEWVAAGRQADRFDLVDTNKEAVLEVLGRFTEDLQALSRAIRWGEGDKLFELFSRTREIRRGIVAMGQESAEPNFGRDRGKH